MFQLKRIILDVSCGESCLEQKTCVSVITYDFTRCLCPGRVIRARDRLVKPSSWSIVLLSTPAAVILYNDAALQSVAIH